MKALHSALQSLKEKNKAFIGNRKDKITSANADGFKQGLDWAIDTIETAIEQEKKEDRQYSFATFDEIISFLKSKGYKIMRPVNEWVEC